MLSEQTRGACLAGQCAVGSQSDKLKKPGWLQVIKHVDAANLKDEQASVNTDNDGNTLIFLNLVSSRRQHRIQMC